MSNVDIAGNPTRIGRWNQGEKTSATASWHISCYMQDRNDAVGDSHFPIPKSINIVEDPFSQLPEIVPCIHPYYHPLL
jgi:hypothetical protein